MRAELGSGLLRDCPREGWTNLLARLALGRVAGMPFPEQGLKETRIRLSQVLDAFNIGGHAEVIDAHELIEYVQ